MKIAFLQYEQRDRVGVMVLSAMLKKHGHLTDVFTVLDEDAVNDILKFKPDILGLSASTTEHNFLYDIAEKVKKINKKIFVVLGGPHATFFPEEIHSRDMLDAVCQGEGDLAMVELANRLERGQDIGNISNLWIKQNGKIIKNEIGRLIENLDELPFPDRDIYYNKYPILKENPTKTFILGRGCPFNCSYCFNHQMRELFKGKGRYVRLPSVEYAIRQIKEVQDKYGFKWVQLNDDTINFDKRWLLEFFDAFKKEIGVKYICNIRVDMMDEEMALKMIETGIDRANFAVEHGNEEFRRKVLNRPVSNEKILAIASIFRKHNIRMTTSSIVGFPGETLDLAFETVELNRKIQPEFAICFILVPYLKTDIYNYCFNNNLLKEKITIDNLPAPTSYYWNAEKKASTVVKLDNEKELVNLHKLFGLLVNYRKLEPILRIFMKLPPNRFYDFISQVPVIKRKIKYAGNLREKISHIKGLFSILIK
ncbi:MAG: radical SAM protein [bacterium]|nr:radical SAM protein [bacterium]